MASSTGSTIRNALIVVLLAAFFLAAGVYLFEKYGTFFPGTSSPEAQREPVLEAPEDSARALRPRQRGEEPGLRFESPFVAVAEKLKPAVVSIVVRKQVEGGDGGFFGDLFRRERSHPQITSGGTGVIIDPEGHVLTNHHVVEGAAAISVTLLDGEEREAELVGADPETDLALLEIGKVRPDWAAILGNSDEIRIGDWAVAMGNPAGLDWTLTVGVISAKGRSDLLIAGGAPTFQDFIQTDASINFGNSGGPLANIHGEVIGINAATNTAAQGIGFAIPINMAKEILGELKSSGYVRRGYLGMVPVPLTDSHREALGLPPDVEGVFVESVSEGTPADEGGLRASDVIVEVDDLPVSEVADFRLRVARHKPGQELTLTVLRDGRTRKLDFVLADRNEYVQGAMPEELGQAWMGVHVVSLDSPLGRELELEVRRGVIVSSVDPGSPAEGELQRGDVIVEVDGEGVVSLQDWREETSRLAGIGRAVLVMFHRGGKGPSRFVALKR